MGFAVSTSSHSKVQTQTPFQPGSTPFRDKRRYLCEFLRSLDALYIRLSLCRNAAFNMLGLIHVVDRDDQNIVTIEFHDRSARTGSHFNDTFKFTLGSLGRSFLPPSLTRLTSRRRRTRLHLRLPLLLRLPLPHPLPPLRFLDPNSRVAVPSPLRRIRHRHRCRRHGRAHGRRRDWYRGDRDCDRRYRPRVRAVLERERTAEVRVEFGGGGRERCGGEGLGDGGLGGGRRRIGVCVVGYGYV